MIIAGLAIFTITLIILGIKFKRIGRWASSAIFCILALGYGTDFVTSIIKGMDFRAIGAYFCFFLAYGSLGYVFICKYHFKKDKKNATQS